MVLKILLVFFSFSTYADLVPRAQVTASPECLELVKSALGFKKFIEVKADTFLIVDSSDNMQVISNNKTVDMSNSLKCTSKRSTGVSGVITMAISKAGLTTPKAREINSSCLKPRSGGSGGSGKSGSKGIRG